MKILILTEDKDTNYFGRSAIAASDLVIVRRASSFDIIKSRYGRTYLNIPDILLLDVLGNPSGRFVAEWV